MYYFVRGGRTGKKVHRASSGSSCLDCGHWTRHSVLAFAEGPLTRETRDSLVARGARFCEKCFPAGPEGIGFARIAIAAAHYFKPGERVVEKASKRRGTVNRIEEKGEDTIVVVIFDDRLAALNARPPEKRLGVVPVEAASPWALRKLSTKEAKEEEARKEEAAVAQAAAQAAQAAGEAETDALAQGIAIDEAIDNLEKTARRVVLAWKFEKISGDDAVRELAGAIGEIEKARAKPTPKLSVDDAIGLLAGSSHGIFSTEKAREIAEVFAIDPDSVAPQTFTDSRSRHKGVTLAGKTEGEKGEGVDAINLARSICDGLGLPNDLPYYGRGSNMSELVSRIVRHFKPVSSGK